MKAVFVIEKQTGNVLSEFIYLPFCFPVFSIELSENFERFFVIRNAKTNKVTDKFLIGNKDVKIKIIEKNI